MRLLGHRSPAHRRQPDLGSFRVVQEQSAQVRPCKLLFSASSGIRILVLMPEPFNVGVRQFLVVVTFGEICEFSRRILSESMRDTRHFGPSYTDMTARASTISPSGKTAFYPNRSRSSDTPDPGETWIWGLSSRATPSLQVPKSASHFDRRAANLARDLVVAGPNVLWVADLTYINISGGFVYAALITPVVENALVLSIDKLQRDDAGAR